MANALSDVSLDDPRYDPSYLFDTLKSKFNIEKDSTLASMLKIDRLRFSKIRDKLFPVSANLLVRIHDLSGIPIEDLRKMMLSDVAKPKIKRLAGTVQLPIVEKKSRARYSAEFKINAVQMISESRTCAAIARDLNLPLQTLNNWYIAYRSGSLVSAIWLTVEETTYIQGVLKKRASELRKGALNAESRHEKKFIAELQKKLVISE
jgi:transposase-like protein